MMRVQPTPSTRIPAKTHQKGPKAKILKNKKDQNVPDFFSAKIGPENDQNVPNFSPFLFF